MWTKMVRISSMAEDVPKKGLKRFFADENVDGDVSNHAKRAKISTEEETEDIKNLESFIFGNAEVNYGDSDSDGSVEDENDEDEAPAWVDEDDEQLKVNITTQYMLKKLRKDQSEKVIDGVQYQERLREQFEKMNGTADWVKSARKDLAAEEAEQDTDDEYGGVDLKTARQRLLRDAAPVVAGDRRSHLGVGPLPVRTIDVRRVNDLTLSVPCRKEVMRTMFHPSQSLALVLANDKTVRLYEADGDKNPCKRQVNWSNLILRDACFSPDGSSVLAVADHSVSLPVLDVATGKTSVVASLMGHSSKAAFHKLAAGPSPLLEPSLRTSGLMAVAAQDGAVHMIDARTRHVARSVALQAPVVGLSFFPGKDVLVTATAADATVCLWDVRNGRCLNRFTDASAFNISSLAVSPRATLGDHAAGSWLATGSKSGIVSLYGLGAHANDDDTTDRLVAKQPTKAIQNLLTAADVVAFHPTSELLLAASSETADALKLIHVPSATVFQNWPTNQTPLKKVTAASFSNDGRWMCVGNHQGSVSMFELSHFAAKLLNKND